MGVSVSPSVLIARSIYVWPIIVEVVNYKEMIFDMSGSFSFIIHNWCFVAAWTFFHLRSFWNVIYTHFKTVFIVYRSQQSWEKKHDCFITPSFLPTIQKGIYSKRIYDDWLWTAYHSSHLWNGSYKGHFYYTYLWYLRALYRVNAKFLYCMKMCRESEIFLSSYFVHFM